MKRTSLNNKKRHPTALMLLLIFIFFVFVCFLFFLCFGSVLFIAFIFFWLSFWVFGGSFIVKIGRSLLLMLLLIFFWCLSFRYQLHTDNHFILGSIYSCFFLHWIFCIMVYFKNAEIHEEAVKPGDHALI